MNGNTSVYTPGALSQQVLAIPERFAILHPDMARAITAEIASKISSPQGVISFDVFDTLLLRNHRAELTRFYEVAGLVATHLQSRQIQVSQADVLCGRLLANRLSYRLSVAREGCREGTIADIYRVLLTQLQVPDSATLIDECIDIELTYEVSQLTVNQPLMQLIHAHVARGGRAIYVSDMYLGASHINTLFARLGVDVELFTATYSSADTILSKRSGKIWPWLLNELQVAASQMVHVGDSLVSDYQSPHAHGITAVYLPIPLQMRRDIVADHGAMIHQLESLHLPIRSWIAPPHW